MLGAAAHQMRCLRSYQTTVSLVGTCCSGSAQLGGRPGQGAKDRRQTLGKVGEDAIRRELLLGRLDTGRDCDFGHHDTARRARTVRTASFARPSYGRSNASHAGRSPGSAKIKLTHYPVNYGRRLVPTVGTHGHPAFPTTPPEKHKNPRRSGGFGAMGDTGWEGAKLGLLERLCAMVCGRRRTWAARHRPSNSARRRFAQV